MTMRAMGFKLMETLADALRVRDARMPTERKDKGRIVTKRFRKDNIPLHVQSNELSLRPCPAVGISGCWFL